MLPGAYTNSHSYEPAHKPPHEPTHAYARSLAAATMGMAGLLGVLSGCGAAQDGPSGAGDGRQTLRAGAVSLSCPEGWTELPARSRGEADAAAVLVEGTGKNRDEVAKVAVQLRFMKAGDAATAAAGAMASVQPGAKINGSKQFRIGDRDAERIDYTYAVGQGAERVRGVDVVTMDPDDEPVLVRINATGNALSDAEINRIVTSVAVTGRGA
ncbi:hypothetical protein [Streptomyces sp. NPDC051219]|uniref:hypothetical protein n=1 Tax=Streptomyces sp. NPDC051219 TaxID=3155283 RepID=UPI003425FE63